MDTLRGQVRLMSKLGGQKNSEVDVLSVYTYLGHPLLSATCCAKKAVCIEWLYSRLILHVLRARGFPQIIESIVRTLSVFVVNIAFRPRSSHIEPSKPVSTIKCSKYSYVGIPRCFTEASSNRSDWRSVARTNSPRKNSSFLIVVKQLAQAFYGKIGLSHDALLKLIGEKPARVESTCGLRYFNTTV